jgi:hypothetical protein
MRVEGVPSMSSSNWVEDGYTDKVVQGRETIWRGDTASLNYIETSTWAR